jgi:hypothetical protein
LVLEQTVAPRSAYATLSWSAPSDVNIGVSAERQKALGPMSKVGEMLGVNSRPTVPMGDAAETLLFGKRMIGVTR